MYRLLAFSSVSGGLEHNAPHSLAVIPFILLLALIALGPLFFKKSWDKNYKAVSILLGLGVVLYYLVFLRDYHSIMHTIAEYLSFIALLSSLYFAAGGIHIKVNKRGTATVNVVLLFIGAILANVVGTTGASMLLIRPFIRINKDRIRPYLIIFFIFIVSNVGGALTPIGDPPLFLGFLSGVPFFWVLAKVWYIWLTAVLLILSIFFVIDSRNKRGDINETDEVVRELPLIEFKGIQNVFMLAVILVAVFLDNHILKFVPSFSPLPFGIREIIMFLVILWAKKKSDDHVLKLNEFETEPIKEVAYLFIGIFLTMMPALSIISGVATNYSEHLNEGMFYWASGGLSAVLDNAPTYMNFLSAAMGKFGLNISEVPHSTMKLIEVGARYIEAISVASVFFGAMTYIGNGPNFMVKSISESVGIRMPSFVTYIIKYSIPVLLPVYTIVWFLYFR